MSSCLDLHSTDCGKIHLNNVKVYYSEGDFCENEGEWPGQVLGFSEQSVTHPK